MQHLTFLQNYYVVWTIALLAIIAKQTFILRVGLGFLASSEAAELDWLQLKKNEWRHKRMNSTYCRMRDPHVTVDFRA